MPYGKYVKRYGSSAFRKGKRLYSWGRKNPKQAAAMARAALKGVKMLRGIVNSERMYRDATLSLGSVSSIVHPLCAIPQGDNSTQRTGNSILVRSFYMRGNMAINPSVTSNTRISLMLVQDKQQIADTTPTAADILTNGNDPDSLLATNTAGRFKVLWRKTYTLLPQTSGSRNAVDIHKYFNLYSHVRFNGTSSTDIQKGGYYLVFVSSEITNFPSITFNTRLGYHDN